MEKPRRLRRKFGFAFAWLAFAGLCAGIFLLYRAAEPSADRLLPNFNRTSASTVSMRLEGTTFDSYVGNAKIWSLYARVIEGEQPANGSVGEIENATITDIRDGKLYEQPGADGVSAARNSAAGVVVNRALQSTTQPPLVATFSAANGAYVAGGTSALPLDIQTTYVVQRELRLTVNVIVKAVNGDKLEADTLTILDMVNRRNNKPERRLLCEHGAKVTTKDGQIQANVARYDPATRMVEALGGARAKSKSNTMQAERLFWSLGDGIVRCPEAASGTWSGTPYTAEGLSIDTRKQTIEGNTMRMQLFTGAIAGLGLTLPIAGQTSKPVSSPPAAHAPSNQKSGAGSGLPQTNPAPGTTDKMATFIWSHYYLDEKTGLGSGHAFTYKLGDAILTGDNVSINTKKNLLDADTNLALDDPKHHATANKAHVDRTKGKEVALYTGNVVLVLKPEIEPNAGKMPARGSKELLPAPVIIPPEVQNGIGGQPPAGVNQPEDRTTLQKRGATIYCDNVEHRYKLKYFILRGHVIAKQRILRENNTILERTLTCEHLEYDAKADKMTLFPPVALIDSDGQQGRNETDKVTIGTKEGEENIASPGRMIGTIFPPQDDEADTPDPNPPPAQAQPKPQGNPKK